MPKPHPSVPVIEMRDVAVAAAIAPNTPVVEGVNWRVDRGDFWVIGGLPGSGKSDLLTTAAGLLRPLRGEHLLFGREMARLREDELVHERLRVGLVFANEGRLFNHLTVSENLALPICYHQNCSPADARERVRAVLECTGLESVAHNTPASVNRNLRPRVALARALALEPEVLLLDNPLRGMDPVQLRWWLDFLGRLCSGRSSADGCQITLVVAADDFRPWRQQAGQFGLLHQGRWQYLGGTEQLLAHEEPLLRELLGSGS